MALLQTKSRIGPLDPDSQATVDKINVFLKKHRGEPQDRFKETIAMIRRFSE